MLVFSVPATSGAGKTDLPDDPPNIVVFYLDDTSPHDGSLWNDPARTPNIYEHFIERGIDFPQAIGEDPLCCPARANLLTGLHTHNNGVIKNEAVLFDPSEHIGAAMKDAGYASMFIGKYLNRNSVLTPQQWLQHDAGWTHLDVTKGTNGSFWNFIVHTKEREFRLRGVHSTQFVADDAIARFRQTPAETPVFAVLSIYNLHMPNVPMPQDVGDTRCANIPPYNPPNYNEADVSDKPAHIQALPLLPDAAGWPMVRNCEAMLGVDRAVGQVIEELELEGRLDNTLLVFTADNGMGWGAHRIGQNKIWPYTTPLPLHMRWPAAGWGDDVTTVPEVVSNIDLAPTFCDLAQSCVLGPFAHGNGAPDGKSLVPLLKGDAPDLRRDAVLEAMYGSGGLSYTALRTTALYDPGNRWHYVEYANGERELYDLIADQWEMDNLASNPRYSKVVASLSARLADLRVEGIAEGNGTITVGLDLAPNRVDDYSFTGDLGFFTLDDDLNTTLPAQRTWAGLPSGLYEITRPAIAPWVPLDLSCDGVYVARLYVGELLIYLHPEEHVTCTFVDAGPRPDAMISLSATGTYKQDNLYQLVPTIKQVARRNNVVIGGVYDYFLKFQNDSRLADTLIVRGAGTGPSTVSAAYYVNNIDVTAEVVAGTYRIEALAPGATTQMVLRLTIGAGTGPNAIFRVEVRASSETAPNTLDAVRAAAAR